MKPRLVLPDEFHRRAFAVNDARDAGLSSGRLRGKDLSTPFRGTRVPVTWDLRDPATVARAFAPRLKPHQALGGISAAALWGIPLPPGAQHDRRAHVIVPGGRNRPSARHVASRSVAPDRWDVVDLDGIAVASPTLTLLTLVRHLAGHDLAVVVDALRSTSERYESLLGRSRPLATPAEIDAAGTSAAGMPGVDTLRAAIAFGRDNVESPRETLLRWALVQIGGLPEPLINVEARAAGRKLGTPDVSYPWAELGIEYEGDGHRTDRSRWQRDIGRVERFADHGWHLMRVTSVSLFPDPWPLIGRVARHLAKFGFSLDGLPQPQY